MSAQAFQVTKTTAPAKYAAWALPIGWVELTDEDGAKAIGAVMKDGAIHSDCFGSMGHVIGHQDCAATCRAALALFA